MNNSWKILGTINQEYLIESRCQLHYAIQFIAATSAALAQPLPDYSHSSLEWNSELNVFAGTIIQGKKPFRVALEPISLTLLILDQQWDAIAALPLQKKTMDEGLNWLKQTIANLGADAEKVAFLAYPPNDFPDHPVAHGAVFDQSGESSRQELTNYYANTQQLLQDIVAQTANASPIHIWPHHFDMAILISIPGMKNGEAMTIGVGLSPGDTSYNEPYWYISPYPYPNTEHLPPLNNNGFWHTQHWLGAVLTTSKLIIPADENMGERQQHQVQSFVDFALKKSEELLIN